MNKETIRKPTKDDVEYLINNIRQEDIEEIEAASDISVREALESTPNLLDNSSTWEVNGKLVCMFGITPCEDDKMGVIWMLATEEFHKYSKLFAVKSKKVILGLVEKYEYVFNFVYGKNTKSIKWLEWVGFHICDPEPLGKKGEAFHRFEILNV